MSKSLDTQTPRAHNCARASCRLGAQRGGLTRDRPAYGAQVCQAGLQIKVDSWRFEHDLD